MRATYRVTPLLAWIFSLVILAGSGVMLGFFVRDTVRHVSADDRPATITDISGTAGRSTSGNRRRERTISFELSDGTEHAALARNRWLWWPDEGDTVHVHRTSDDGWEISEEFSWLRHLGYIALFAIPWVVAALKAWEWAEKTLRPERWEAKKREERRRARERRLARTRRQR